MSIAILWFLFGHAVGALASEDRILSVCEVMPELKRYNGRVLALRGEFEAGEEQFSLSGGTCKKRFETSGYVWPSALQLRTPYDTEAPAQVPFVPDLNAIDTFLQAAKQAQSKNGAARGCVTVVGMLQTRDDYEVRTGPDGRKRAHGFGHMGAFPGQLIIKTVRDYNIRPWSANASACEADGNSR